MLTEAGRAPACALAPCRALQGGRRAELPTPVPAAHPAWLADSRGAPVGIGNEGSAPAVLSALWCLVSRPFPRLVFRISPPGAGAQGAGKPGASRAGRGPRLPAVRPPPPLPGQPPLNLRSSGAGRGERRAPAGPSSPAPAPGWAGAAPLRAAPGRGRAGLRGPLSPPAGRHRQLVSPVLPGPAIVARVCPFGPNAPCSSALRPLCHAVVSLQGISCLGSAQQMWAMGWSGTGALSWRNRGSPLGSELPVLEHKS